MFKITKKDLHKLFAVDNNISIPAATTELSPSAILVPIIDEVELMVLFTRRTLDLKNHAGQISFPGGKMETGDLSLEATAVREAVEEIGLAAEQIQILGQLQPLVSSSNYLVTPFVGLVQPPLDLTIDPIEVAEVFIAPLSFVLDPRNQQRGIYVRDGKHIDIYFIEYENHRIWGLTARVLVAMTKQLQK